MAPIRFGILLQIKVKTESTGGAKGTMLIGILGLFWFLPSSLFAQKYADLPGVRIWCTDTGGNAIPVVFLHANTGSSANWEHQIPVFTAGARCAEPRPERETAGSWGGRRAKASNSATHRKFFVRRAVGQSSLPEDTGEFPCEIEIFSLMLPLLPQW